MNKPTKAGLAREYREKYGQKMPTLKLARILYNENKLLFKNVESARDRLKYIEGKSGAAARKKIAGSKFEVAEHRPKNPYSLPESDEETFEPYILKGSKRVLVINDVHLPYHSISAIETMLDYSKKEKPDTVVCNGDIIDCFSLSKFSKDPKKRNFAGELNQLKEFFEIIQRTFKGAKVIYKLGNHELRYQHFLFQKAHELVGVEEFEFANIIKARTNGIEVVEDKRIIKLNHLDLLHGHEFVTGFFNPVNVARGLYLRAKVSAMQGHSHKSSAHTESDLHKNIKTTWSVGALCGLSPEYAPYNSWNHGFALVDLASDKVGFEVRNKSIYKGKVL